MSRFKSAFGQQPKLTPDKITERAEAPGLCLDCGSPIYVGDVIVRDHIQGLPVARHAACDPDFKFGGSQPVRKLTPDEIAAHQRAAKHRAVEQFNEAVERLMATGEDSADMQGFLTSACEAYREGLDREEAERRRDG